MNASPSLLWDKTRRNESVSQCGRYRLMVRELTEGQLLCLVYFYGYLAHRAKGCVRSELINRVDRWCADHRARLLPLIGEFEDWASRRYGSNLAYVAGAMARRDRVKDLICCAGDKNLGLPILHGHRTMTIADTFRMLYECIDPEVAESCD